MEGAFGVSIALGVFGILVRGSEGIRFSLWTGGREMLC